MLFVTVQWFGKLRDRRGAWPRGRLEAEEELSVGRWRVREELHERRRRTQMLTI